MQIVIDIPKEYYDEILTQGMDSSHLALLYRAIINSVPLPKGHGRLIEKSKIGHWIKIPYGFKCSNCLVVDTHTSIFCPSCGAKMVEKMVEQETKINEDISKGFEEFTRMMFRQGQEESEGTNADSN